MCGQSVPYYFVLKNESWFAFASIKISFFSDFSYMEELPEEVEYELLPGEQYKYETSFVCRYRGEYEVGIKEIIITDFWGLFRVKFGVQESKKVIAAPKLIQPDELKSIPDISSMMQRDSSHSTELDAVTRDYATGDAPKQINWKVTARMHKLMSRKSIGEEKRGAALIFDTKRYSAERGIYLPIENKILEMALALAFFMTKSNIALSYFYRQSGAGVDIRQGRLDCVGDIENFYGQIKEVDFEQGADMCTCLSNIFRGGRLMEQAIVFLVLHEMDQDIMKMTYRIAANDTIVVCYIVTDENVEEYCALSDTNRRIIAITPEQELEEVL